jgi:hypothetical protein
VAKAWRGENRARAARRVNLKYQRNAVNDINRRLNRAASRSVWRRGLRNRRGGYHQWLAKILWREMSGVAAYSMTRLAGIIIMVYLACWLMSAMMAGVIEEARQ